MKRSRGFIDVLCFVMLILVALFVSDLAARITNFPDGISVRGTEITGNGDKTSTTGTVYYVCGLNGTDSTAVDGNSDSPFDTLEYVLENKVTSGVGDIVAIMPGHLETIDSTIVVNTSNTYIVGLGNTPKQQRFTFEIGESAAEITPFDVDCENVIFDNLYIVLASTAESDVAVFDVDASGFELRNCLIDFAAQDKMEGVNFANTTYDGKVLGCKFINIAAGEAVVTYTSTRTTVANCTFDFTSGNGVAIEQGDAEVDSTIIARCLFIGDSTALDFVTWNAAPGDGHAVYLNYALGTGADASTFGGTDTDLDYYFSNNYIDATTGTPTVYDPSP